MAQVVTEATDHFTVDELQRLYNDFDEPMTYPNIIGIIAEALYHAFTTPAAFRHSSIYNKMQNKVVFLETIFPMILMKKGNNLSPSFTPATVVNGLFGIPPYPSPSTGTPHFTQAELHRLQSLFGFGNSLDDPDAIGVAAEKLFASFTTLEAFQSSAGFKSMERDGLGVFLRELGRLIVLKKLENNE